MAVLTRFRDTVTMSWAMIGCGDRNIEERWRGDERPPGSRGGRGILEREGRAGVGDEMASIDWESRLVPGLPPSLHMYYLCLMKRGPSLHSVEDKVEQWPWHCRTGWGWFRERARGF